MSRAQTQRTSKTLKLPYRLVSTLEDIRSDIESDGFDSARAVFRFQADMAWIEKEFTAHLPAVGPILDRLKSAGDMMTNAQSLKAQADTEFESLEREFSKLLDASTEDDDE